MNHWNEQDELHDEAEWEDEYDYGPSKSQKKREMAEVQSHADQLTQLSKDERTRLELPEPIEKAVIEAAKMKASGARKRQIKFIAKLLTQDEAFERVTNYLQNRDAIAQERNRHFHQLENWRDRLVTEQDDALQALLDEHPGLDRQEMRQLMRNAGREAETGKPAGAGKKLFRYLKEQLG